MRERGGELIKIVVGGASIQSGRTSSPRRRKRKRKIYLSVKK